MATELNFSVNGLDIAAQAWGEEGGSPVMAIHGWLDNAASFCRLGPLLAEHGYYVVALDLAGQGKSSFRSAHGSYNIWDDLLDITAVADQLSWAQHSMIGHSRGAMMSLLYAATLPDKVNRLALVDGFVPLPHAPEKAPEQLAKYLRDQRNLLGRPGRSFSSREELLAARCEKNGLPAEDCLPLIERGVVLNNEKLHEWRMDTRAMGASAFKLSDAHCRAFIDALQAPCDLFIAEQGMGLWRDFDALLDYAQSKVRYHYFDAGHHLHMLEAESRSITAVLLERWRD